MGSGNAKIQVYRGPQGVVICVVKLNREEQAVDACLSRPSRCMDVTITHVDLSQAATTPSTHNIAPPLTVVVSDIWCPLCSTNSNS